MCNVLFSYACILIGQVYICRYIFVAMCSFVPPFREATLCGVQSCVFDKSGCAAGEKRLRNTALDNTCHIPDCKKIFHQYKANSCQHVSHIKITPTAKYRQICGLQPEQSNVQDIF
jgi:hypothetical protein